VVTVHNLGDADVRATLELGEDVVAVDDVLEDHAVEVGDGGRVEVELEAYGYLWLHLRRDGDRRLS
jgi:hypothetical protein